MSGGGEAVAASGQPPPARGWFEVLTGGGPAAIAIVRLWGAAAASFLQYHVRLQRPREARELAAGDVLRAALHDGGGEIDDILVSMHGDAAKGSDEPEVRLHLHGGGGVLSRCCELLVQSNLVRIESAGHDADDAVAPSAGLFGEGDALARDASVVLPRMATLRGARWLLRQPDVVRAFLDDAIRRLEREGERAFEPVRAACRGALAAGAAVERFATPLRIAVVGPPNAGKSTLINVLCRQQVSLVSPLAGTTRDWVEAHDELDGFPVVWIDTAGLREAGDELEAEGIRRTRALIAESDAAVVVLDASPGGGRPRTAFLRASAGLDPAVVLLNKCDLLGVTAAESAAGRAVLTAIARRLPEAWRARLVATAATTGIGLTELRERLSAAAARHTHADPAQPAAYSQRLRAALGRAAQSESVALLVGALVDLQRAIVSRESAQSGDAV